MKLPQSKFFPQQGEKTENSRGTLQISKIKNIFLGQQNSQKSELSIEKDNSVNNNYKTIV